MGIAAFCCLVIIYCLQNRMTSLKAESSPDSSNKSEIGKYMPAEDIVYNLYFGKMKIINENECKKPTKTLHILFPKYLTQSTISEREHLMRAKTRLKVLQNLTNNELQPDLTKSELVNKIIDAPGRPWNRVYTRPGGGNGRPWLCAIPVPCNTTTCAPAKPTKRVTSKTTLKACNKKGPNQGKTTRTKLKHSTVKCTTEQSTSCMTTKCSTKTNKRKSTKEPNSMRKMTTERKKKYEENNIRTVFPPILETILQCNPYKSPDRDSETMMNYFLESLITREMKPVTESYKKGSGRGVRPSTNNQKMPLPFLTTESELPDYAYEYTDTYGDREYEPYENYPDDEYDAPEFRSEYCDDYFDAKDEYYDQFPDKKSEYYQNEGPEEYAYQDAGTELRVIQDEYPEDFEGNADDNSENARPTTCTPVDIFPLEGCCY